MSVKRIRLAESTSAWPATKAIDIYRHFLLDQRQFVAAFFADDYRDSTTMTIVALPSPKKENTSQPILDQDHRHVHIFPSVSDGSYTKTISYSCLVDNLFANCLQMIGRHLETTYGSPTLPKKCLSSEH